jgi:hypothetical protein
MAVDHHSSSPHVPIPAPGAARRIGGGTAGNERLTAVTGALLVALLAVIGVTIIALRGLLSAHMFVGMLLIPPVLLKMAATGYRFARYYTGEPRYRLKGPPATALRLIAPVVVVSTVAVLASGVALLFIGPASRSTLLPIHKVTFIVWVVFTALHVLGHLTAMPRELRAEWSPHADVQGRTGRTLALAGAVVAGAVLAILTLPEFGAWVHSQALFHDGG